MASGRHRFAASSPAIKTRCFSSTHLLAWGRRCRDLKRGHRWNLSRQDEDRLVRESQESTRLDRFDDLKQFAPDQHGASKRVGFEAIKKCWSRPAVASRMRTKASVATAPGSAALKPQPAAARRRLQSAHP